MALTWRHLVGSTDRLAVEVSLIQDPDEGRFAPRDVAASWGEFRIFVEGRNLCEAKDPSGETLPGARWYLLPVLRFLVWNWDTMTHQGRLPCPPRSGAFAATQMADLELPPPSVRHLGADEWHVGWWEFFRAHCLASARDGGILPNIWFRRSGDDIEISWDNESNPAELPIRFLERQGVGLVSVTEFATVVLGIVGAAVDELLKRVSSSELVALKKELERISLPDLERRWSRHALLLHLRASAEEAHTFLRELVRRLPTLAPPKEGGGAFEPATLPALVFASASPHVSESDVILVMAEIDRSAGDVEPSFSHIAEGIRCPYHQSWRSGHDLALHLRTKLGLGFDTVDMEQVVDDLGISVRSIELSDPSIRAVSFTDDHVVPTILINQNSPGTQRQWSRSATLAHELGHLIFDPRLGRALGISSGPWAPTRFEQRANAFAVMFLMPEPEVSSIFLDTQGDLNERIKVVARHFGSSFRAAVEHLHNLALIERYERDALIDDVEDFAL